MAQAAPSYPVKVTGHLEGPLSRWLWLAKWLLVIPHLVVLFFLIIAQIVVTIIAFFAIIFTERYPRDLFNFSVGVLRWAWRVGFYSYSALGADKYPPFSLDQQEYPANLEVEYPERLHRWLPLVKWLLAVPHALILSFFLGGVGYRMGGLNLILVVFAGVVLLFRGYYPRDLFRLVMGINRWSLRVLPYVLLMTDKYPPFRLDMEEEG